MSLKVFALQELIQDYDRIIYLDVDIIINGDLNEFVNYDLSGYGIGAVPDFQTNRRDLANLSVEHIKYVLDYREQLIGYSDRYFNSGVYIIDNPEKLNSIGYDEFAQKFSPSLVDQDYLNYVYRDDVFILPEKYNFMCDNTHVRDMSYQDRMIDSYNMSLARYSTFMEVLSHGKVKTHFHILNYCHR